jgi:hypothetical protein
VVRLTGRLAGISDGYAVPVIAALRTTLATVLLGLACSFASAPTATAAPAPAECEPLDLDNPTAVREHAAAVTDVFAGRVREVKPRTAVGGGEGKADQDNETSDGPSDGPTRPADPRTTRWQHTVSVESSFQSTHQPGDRVLIVTQPSGRAGGLGKLVQGATYVFFVSGEEGMDHLMAEACAGTTRLPDGLTAELRDQLDATLGEPVDDEPTPDYTLSAPDDGARSTPSLGRLAAPGAALALIGVLGLLLLARIASRRT